MKKILFIATGGTFASGKSENGLRPKFSAEQLLKFFPAAREIAEISAVQIFNLDSTNVGPENWEKIAATIFENYEKFDGFLVAHGTDTMHFSAAAAAFALQNLQKPVVFTGSVLSPENPNSDAERNFIDSLLVARAGDVREVCICFGGEILKATHVRKFTNEATRIFPGKINVFSPVGSHLIGTVNLGKVIDNEIYFLKNGYPREKLKLELRGKFAPEEIAILKIFPGLSGEVLRKFADCKIVILESFGPGNVPFENSVWLNEIANFTKKNSIFISTQNPFGEVGLQLYEVGQRAAAAGAISLKNMTTETAIVKAAWLLGNFENLSKTEIETKMLQSFCGEIREV